MKEKANASYAIPCLFGTAADDFDFDDLFFVTFSTGDEKEALALASCVCGTRMANKALVILDEYGDITYL